MNVAIDQTRKEKLAVFQVALKLLKEGTFHATPLAEIAYQARMSETLMNYVFDSRETLLAELSAMIISRMEKEIDEAGKTTTTFRDGVFNYWKTFYDFYTRHADMIPFIEQFENMKYMLHNGANHPGKFQALISLFKNHVTPNQEAPAETLAWLLHENALSAAKMTVQNHTGVFANPQTLAKFFWKGISCGVVTP